MATITVRVGREEKEISGLTRRTTCSDVLQALLKDKKNLTVENGEPAKVEEIDFSDPKSLKELSQSYVIVETWRGCEKPLPPRTRILAVWQAWGKEQCHVKFSLKKSKHTRYSAQPRENKEEINATCNHAMLSKMHCQQHAEAVQFLTNLSSGQKRRIRRSMMQYQRAVLSQRSKATETENNGEKYFRDLHLGESAPDSAAERCSKTRGHQLDNSRVTLSEEQFVDGIMTGPDCILQHNGKNKFIQSALDNKDLNSEYSTYKRRQIRRRSSLMLEDCEGLNEQNNLLSLSRHKPTIGHYPYCQNSRRRSRSSSRRRRSHKNGRGRVSKSSHRRARLGTRGSTDDNTTSTTTTSTGSEPDCDSHSAGEDADDEKSIKAECGSTIRRKAAPYSDFLAPCAESCRSGVTTASSATVGTDSSSATTTCSESSNTSGSSLSSTSSSDTSGSTDYCERFFAKHAIPATSAPTAATPPAKVATPEKIKSSGGNSGAAKFIKMVSGSGFSFKKKKRSIQVNNDSKTAKSLNVDNSKTLASKSITTHPPKERTEQDTVTDQESNTAKLIATSVTKPKPRNDSAECAEKRLQQDQETANKKVDEAADSEKNVEKWKQVVQSQDRMLQNQLKKVKETNVEIHRIETDVHRWRTQAHGKNYVQDTYLSGLEASSRSPEKTTASPGNNTASNSLRPAQWLAECQDIEALNEYVALSQKIVGMQIKIEEHKRQSEIVLQDMQDEVWKASNDPTKTDGPLSPITAAASALGLVPGSNEDDSSDDESAVQSLSVHKKISAASETRVDKNRLAAAEATLEVEKSNTELETNLYLSLRLSSELQEVEQRMDASRNLLQTKGETLIALVRDLAESPEGISFDLWEEYGGLLTAYDEEMALQRHLALLSDVQTPLGESEMPEFVERNLPETVTSPQLFAETEDDPLSPTTNALHHALSPWLWCECCRMELEDQRQHAYNRPSSPASPHWLSHGSVPLCFSELPLPSPTSVRAEQSPTLAARSLGPLLPMPPIPDCNDSDYDDLAEGTKADANATATIISTESAIPRGIVLRHSGRHQKDKSSQSQIASQLNYLSRGVSTGNPDDSGNASATSSLASTNSDGGSIDMGSRNGSCDGGSPRSTPCLGTESQDSGLSSPFLLNKNPGNKRFVFPLQKHSPVEESSRSGSRSTSRSNSHKSAPAIPPKPKSMTIHSKDDLTQQGKLIRRNSAGRKRSPLSSVSDSKQNNQFGRRASSFGKARIGGGILPNKLNVLLNKPIVQNSHCDLRQSDGQKVSRSKTETAFPNPIAKSRRYLPPPLNILSSTGASSAPCSPYSITNKHHVKLHPRDPRAHPLVSEGKQRLHSETYDNDSDTGLSSLHSADSDLMMYSETLV